jgi:hypothetical protein
MPDVGGIAGAQLKSFIERIERLEEEKRALGERTHPTAPAATVQTTGRAPSLASASVTISAVTTAANPIIGASRMSVAVTNPDAQFRTLLIAPSRFPNLFHLAVASVNDGLNEPNPTTWPTHALKPGTRFDQDRFRVWGDWRDPRGKAVPAAL